MNDLKLIRDYVDTGSQPAFASLTERHMSLVYWTCRRDLDNDQLAEDATQVVFLLLAQKARSFNRYISLPGWLFNTARLVSRNVRKSEFRKRRLEEEAVREMESQHTDAWPQVEPLLNDGLSALGAADRDAIIMRYFEGMSLSEVAAAIGTTEDTARKRVARALDKLRAFLLKKEVAVSSVAIAAMLGEHGAKAAPASAHAAIASLSAKALGAATGHASQLAASSNHVALLHKGITIAMEATQKKILIATGIFAAAMTGVTVSVAVIRSHAATTSTVAPLGSSALVLDLTKSKANGVDSESGRASLLANLQTIATSMRDGNPGWVSDSIAADANLNTKHGHMTQSAFYQSETQFDKATTNRQPQLSLVDCSFDGDKGTAQVGYHMDATASFPGAPPNAAFSADETWTLNLEKRSDRWLIAGAQEDTLTQTLNGRPAE